MPAITTSDGIDLHYEVEGDGDPLILIHGALSVIDFWDTVAPALATRFRVIAYDRRGHGLSGGEPAEGTLHDDVSDVAALTTEVAHAPAHLAGISMGGTVALNAAVSQPGLLRRVAVHEPALIDVLDAHPEHAEALRTVRDAAGETRALLEAGESTEATRVFAEKVAFGPGSWSLIPPDDRASMVAHALTFLGELRDPDARTVDLDRLARGSTPLLVSHGADSLPLFQALHAVLEAGLPRADRHTFENSGHLPNLTEPEEYVEVVSRFFAA